MAGAGRQVRGITCSEFSLTGGAVRARCLPVRMNEPLSIPASAPPRVDNLIQLPTVVLLGCEEDLEARCRAVASYARVLLRPFPIPFLRVTIVASRPLVLVVPARIYGMAPRGFESLAVEAGARLLRVDDAPFAQVELEYRLMDAILHALRARARTAS